MFPSLFQVKKNPTCSLAFVDTRLKKKKGKSIEKINDSATKEMVGW